jgi:hypothetical protein
LKIRAASWGLAPCVWSSSITPLIARCAAHVFAICSTRRAPIPGTLSSFSGSRSSTFRLSIPNFATMRFANAGPTPVIIPEPR